MTQPPPPVPACPIATPPPPGPEPTMIALPAGIDTGLSPHFGDGLRPPALDQHADDSTLGQRVSLGRFDFGVGVGARLDVPRPRDALPTHEVCVAAVLR